MSKLIALKMLYYPYMFTLSSLFLLFILLQMCPFSSICPLPPSTSPLLLFGQHVLFASMGYTYMFLASSFTFLVQFLLLCHFFVVKKYGALIVKKRAIKRDPEGHFIILKGRIHQEDINIVNIYAPNIGALKYIKKLLEDFNKDIDSNTIIVGDFNTPLSKIDRSSKKKISTKVLWHSTMP